MRSLQSRSQKKAIKSPTEIYAWAEKTRIMPQNETFLCFFRTKEIGWGILQILRF